MKGIFSQKLVSIFFFLILAISLPLIVNLALTEQDNRQYAQEATPIYLIPNTQQVAAGEKLIIALQIKTKTTPLKSVQINLTYPFDTLSTPEISYVDSPFTLAVEQMSTNGLIRIGREAETPVVDDNQIAILTFTAKASATPQEISLAPGSFAVSGVDAKQLPVALTLVDSSYYTAQKDSGFFSTVIEVINQINPF